MPQVVFTRRVVAKVQDLQGLIRRELEAVFADATTVLVHECLDGYSRDRNRKIVLAVEVHRNEGAGGEPPRIVYSSHIAKLGDDNVVADQRGWPACLGPASAIAPLFLPIQPYPLPDHRAAVVYGDVRLMIGEFADGDDIRTLEAAAEQAMHGRGVRPDSVERVVSQVFTGLHGRLYGEARIDVRKARAFYRKKLRLTRGADSPVHGWSKGEALALRRDAVWLFCGAHLPDNPAPHGYIDPYHYVLYALQEGLLPPTLIGCSHGDLHGRNVLLVVRLGEAEYPKVIDYDDMRPDNVLVWDFVKLETELKVRLLVQLLHKEAVRKRLLERGAPGSDLARALRHVMRAWRLQPRCDPFAERLERLVCAYLFEAVLAQFTTELLASHRPEDLERPRGERLTGIAELDHLLLLLLTIRREAARLLGNLPARANPREWHDEYQFALAVYALNTMKFPTFDVYQRATVQIAAGVAVGQIRAIPEQWEGLRQLPPAEVGATYQVPLHHAYRHWKEGKPENLDRADEIFRAGRERFGYAVPFMREYVLILASRRRLAEAHAVLEALAGATPDDPEALDCLADLCARFGDYETLCRIGRIFKEAGDQGWEDNPVEFAQLGSLPARQHYVNAYRFYQRAFAISEDHYPGGNAAILAWLVGREAEARALASQVLQACFRAELSGSLNDHWLFCTEATVSLLTEQRDQALQFLRNAVGVLRRNGCRWGMMQSTYKTFCRLCKALGPEALGPVIEYLRAEKIPLEPGPLGDCGGLARSP